MENRYYGRTFFVSWPNFSHCFHVGIQAKSLPRTQPATVHMNGFLTRAWTNPLVSLIYDPIPCISIFLSSWLMIILSRWSENYLLVLSWNFHLHSTVGVNTEFLGYTIPLSACWNDHLVPKDNTKLCLVIKRGLVLPTHLELICGRDSCMHDLPSLLLLNFLTHVRMA